MLLLLFVVFVLLVAGHGQNLLRAGLHILQLLRLRYQLHVGALEERTHLVVDGVFQIPIAILFVRTQQIEFCAGAEGSAVKRVAGN